MSASASLSRKTEAKDTTRTASRSQNRSAASTAEFAEIQSNTFYQIMFDQSISPEAKQAAVAKALTFTGSKEESRTRQKEFEAFKEYLQDARERMNTEIIKLTDTEAFAELQAVYNDMNSALIDFDNKMRPLTEIIEAVHTLRTNGLTFDTFKEIEEDREFEKQNDAEQKLRVDEHNGLIDDIMQLRRDIAALGEQKGFFGFGGIKESARIEIARKQALIVEKDERSRVLSGEIDDLRRARADRANQSGEFAEQKAKLRELLDLTGDEHRERQTDLVKSALHFVQTSKERITSVRSHLDGMNTQVENLFDANQHISRIYAVMGEGLTDAEKANQELRKTFEAPVDGEESLITRHTREENKTSIEQHIAALTDSKSDTMVTFADLTGQTIRIKTMLEANTAQVSRVKTMQSQGVAGVADRLATVLQAVSQAALGESAAAAKDTLALMVKNTNAVAQNQTIANAMGIKDANQDLLRAIDDLGTYGEAIKEATEISTAGVSEARGYLEQLRTLAEDVKGDIGKAFAVHAEAALGETAPAKGPAKSTGSTPFKF